MLNKLLPIYCAFVFVGCVYYVPFAVRNFELHIDQERPKGAVIASWTTGERPLTLTEKESRKILNSVGSAYKWKYREIVFTDIEDSSIVLTYRQFDSAPKGLEKEIRPTNLSVWKFSIADTISIQGLKFRIKSTSGTGIIYQITDEPSDLIQAREALTAKQQSWR